MKFILKILFVTLAIAAIGLSYGTPVEKSTKTNAFRSEFDDFLDLFTSVNLPLSSDKIGCSTTIISPKLVKKFISPNDTEADNANEIKSLGKFKISDKYLGIIFCYSTNISGDLKELFVFDISGNYQSGLIIGIDYRTYFLKSTIDASYHIQTQSYEGEGSNPENLYYSINNGMIVAKN